MGRYKSLALNTAIFGICSFTSKLLVFLMLPFYTTVLSKEEFGTADLINTIVGLLAPVFSLSIAHGVMRFALDRGKDIEQVFTFGSKVSIGGIIFVCFCYPILICIPVIRDYLWIFLLLYITSIFHTLTGLFARGLNKMKYVGIAGVVSSLVVVLSNIILLFAFHCGVNGFLVSSIISNLVFIIILVVSCKMYKYVGGDNNKQLNKEMLAYSIPIIPNTLSWWIQHSANRYILSYYCGVGDVGLYSAASKMPTIIDTFRGVFVQAWQLSTITEYDKENSKMFFRNIYTLYNVFLIVSCSVLLIGSKLLASILYSVEFYEAWTFTPLLIVGILFSSLVAFYSPTYLAHKKTNKLFVSTALGAALTIVVNLMLVPRIGAIGSAVAVVISNIIIFLYIHIDSRKYMAVKLGNFRIYLSYLVITIQGFLITFAKMHPMGVMSMLLTIIVFLLNTNEIKYLIIELYNKIKKKHI